MTVSLFDVIRLTAVSTGLIASCNRPSLTTRHALLFVPPIAGAVVAGATAIVMSQVLVRRLASANAGRRKLECFLAAFYAAVFFAIALSSYFGGTLFAIAEGV